MGGDFRRLWTANAISSLGDGAMLAAGPLFVASRTSDPLLVAAAMFAQQLPWLLFSLIAGAYVDRLDRRRLIVVVNLLRAFAVGGLALGAALDAAGLPVIYAALFLLGTGDSVARNAETALLPSLVGKDDLAAANARIFGATTLGAQLAGPPLGAYLFAIAAALPFGVDAASFVAAAALVGGSAVGALLGGVVAHVFGITAPFWIGATLVALLAVVTWRRFAAEI
jgi:MFS family permease